ncbi:hypothetical protein G5B30_09190 [Sphingobacterium sp. SGG-5]|uniref:hypothetical protein n=1 Tax=Sphingobacterium sp. SGG-5 TaxID=2710881 RepID=UPI0013EC6D01|nr:hypothetical protein [Sphingobacterium sp. SGG-5]NGM62087.1 hypothetical protein [Sphingobacterium sp. SGG-5]
MKSKSKMLKTGLAALFLAAATSVFGQSIDKTNDGAKVNVGPFTAADNASRATALPGLNLANERRDVILFYNDASKPGLTLVASRTEDLSVITPAPSRTAQEFTHYRWFYMGQDGAGAVDGTAFGGAELVAEGLLKTYNAAGDEKLVVTNLTEGYHYFKVRGIVNPDNIAEEELCNIQEEEYVIYVLPELQVAATGTVNGGTAFQYCESDVSEGGTQAKVEINATYGFVRPNTPAVGDFDVKYRWYAVKQAADGLTWPDVSAIATDPTTISDIELLETSSSNATGGILPDFFPQISKIGKYKIFVEAEYAVKDRNYSAADAGGVRVRPHVIYRGFTQDSGSDMVLTVTPKPGKPHITIENITD